jgi:hypothetical protein
MKEPKAMPKMIAEAQAARDKYGEDLTPEEEFLPHSGSAAARSQLAPTWVGTLSENSTASPTPGSGAVVEDVPEPSYYLMIRQRLICHHKLDLSQREGRKYVAAALQGRSYGGRLDEFSYSCNRRSVRQIVRGP